MPMRIDQGALPPGEPGIARKDGLSDGTPVVLRDTTDGGTSLFEILWVDPADASAQASLAASPGDDHTWTFTPTAGVTGPIRIRLTHTSPDGEVTYETRIFGIPDANGVIPPAPGERADPNATVLNATDPEIINACERNWRTDDYPDGNPFGWAFDVATGSTGPGGPTEPTAHAPTHVGGTDAIPEASASTAGLMSIADWNKLDGIPDGGAPALHVSTHLPGGADALPIATQTVTGLMDKVDKTALDNLVATGAGPHADTHVGGTDAIPEASALTAGLMSIDDWNKLDGIPEGGGATGPHGDDHLTLGADPIALATPTSPGLMSATDKATVDGILPPEATLWMPLGEDKVVDFSTIADIATNPKGYILAQQNGTGGFAVTFDPPNGYTILSDNGDKLLAEGAANAYTLYEYDVIAPFYIHVSRKKLTPYTPPLPIPTAFIANGVGLWSVNDLLSNAYEGPLFRVRRASDNAELDIGINTGGTCDEDALAAFCGASMGFVTKLYDQNQLGTVNDFVQAVQAAQPRIYNGAAVEKAGSNVVMKFDGVDDCLSGNHLCGLQVGMSLGGGSLWALWKPAPQAFVAAGTPGRFETVLSVGNTLNGWAWGYNSNKFYNCVDGRGYGICDGLTNDQFVFHHANQPSNVVNSINRPTQNGVGFYIGGSGNNIEVDLSGGVSHIGKTDVTANSLGQYNNFDRQFLSGSVSTFVVLNTSVSTTSTNWYAARDWCEYRRTSG